MFARIFRSPIRPGIPRFSVLRCFVWVHDPRGRHTDLTALPLAFGQLAHLEVLELQSPGWGGCIQRLALPIALRMFEGALR